MRILKGLLALAFALLGLAAAGVTLAAVLLANGQSPPLLSALAGAVGQVLAGQETKAMALALRLDPAGGRLSGTARLTVRAAAGRQRLYFLLNDGLSVNAAWEEDSAATQVPLPVYRLWLLAVVELPEANAGDSERRIAIEYSGTPRATPLGAAPVFEADGVVLDPMTLWYPADLRGFFLANVEVLLPAGLTLVHNGTHADRTTAGTSARVRFSTPRPVPGLALVAGRYAEYRGESKGARVLLPADVRLDPKRLVGAVAGSQQTFTSAWGDTGLPRVTLFVDRRLSHAFNDGSGLIGVPVHAFADGEYGFGTIAREVARSWWGATVGRQVLAPGSGGEWVIEGLARLAGLRAVREHLGEAARLRALAGSFFDPDRTGTLATMSPFDRRQDPRKRAAMAAKGAYVAYMLEQQLGSGDFDAAAGQFLRQFRLRNATAPDMQAVFSAIAHRDLAPFFQAWVYGDQSIDLALDPAEGNATVRNHRAAPAPAEVALWRFPPASEPEKQTIALGATTPIGNAERDVLDPLGSVADMLRTNNVLPRHENPRWVARSARGDLMVVYGEPYPWEPARITVVPGSSGRAVEWTVERGLAAEPAWSADGTRIIAVERPRPGKPALFAFEVTDGSTHALGRDTIASGAADGTLVARGSRLYRLAGGRTEMIAEHPGSAIGAPLAAPNGGAAAYAVRWSDGTMDLCVLAEDGESRVLFTWPDGPLRWNWSPDGSRLFAVLSGDWDWQLWEIDLDGSQPRALVREAARITDLAIGPDGNLLALVAQAEVDDPLVRSEVFVVDRRAGDVRHFKLSGRTAYSAAWLDQESLAVVVADPTYPSLPVLKELRRLRVIDGSLDTYP